MTYTLVTFVETALFSRLVERYWSDDEYAELQGAIAAYPEAAPVIPGSGGVRKLRWSLEGRGKRGGARVIYYVKVAHGEIWMLTAYPKNVRDNIPPATLKAIKEEVDAITATTPKRRR